jgi:metal-dependent amidase/aminoacylase/carboxypeptidase family protein
LHGAIEAAAAALQDQVIAWRRDLHQHPELHRCGASARAGHEVKTGVAHTGGLLKGALAGPVVALRADDALPVAEQVDVPFASKARA